MPLLKESELILNPDGSVYHLNLLPRDIAHDIITVGDPDRVEHVSQHFDTIELVKHKREFKTITGSKGGKRLTVISTGIGTDNIDIVMNELDALVNIDLNSRQIKNEKMALRFYRIGTSGAVHPSIPLDAFLVSKYAIGLDGLMQYYEHENPAEFDAYCAQENIGSSIYFSTGDFELSKAFTSAGFIPGLTITATGFYGPQNRELRLASTGSRVFGKLRTFQFDNLSPTNLEMETAGIYSLGNLLGHKCISLNAILANRISGAFSSNPQETVDKLIETTLDLILKQD